MLKKISLQALQFTLNQGIALDPSLKQKFLEFEDRIIEIVVLPLHVHFYMTFKSGKIELLKEINRTPDTIIHSSPIGLIRLSFLPASKTRSLFNDTIKISGDIELGQRLKKVIDSMNIDWEGHLAHFTGDVAAYHIGKIVRKGHEIQKKCVTTIQNQTKDYLLHELQWIVSSSELNQFYQDVDDTRLRTERLQAHFEYLSAKNEKN